MLFDKENPRSAVNRRISIVVMTREADLNAKLTDVPQTAQNEETEGDRDGAGHDDHDAGVDAAIP